VIIRAKWTQNGVKDLKNNITDRNR